MPMMFIINQKNHHLGKNKKYKGTKLEEEGELRNFEDQLERILAIACSTIHRKQYIGNFKISFAINENS